MRSPYQEVTAVEKLDTKDCFSCEVSFDLQVSYNSGSFKDYPTHMEYIFVKRSGKWYIADMVMLK